MLVRFAVLVAAAAAVAAASGRQQPNPPVWPSTVRVFGPKDSAATIEQAVQAAFKENGGHEPPNHGQFSSSRFAFLFEPGVYDVEVPVGYYTQVLGLGEHPANVTFSSSKGVYAQESDWGQSGALCTFWRGAENFRNQANYKWYVGLGMMWAVSQAAPVRRLMVDHDLMFFEYEPPIRGAGYASGGYAANVDIGGRLALGSQQQWFTRNARAGLGFANGAWNIVVSGVQGAPPFHCSNGGGRQPVAGLSRTPLVAEKPFISMDPSTGKYSLRVPAPKSNTSGTDFNVSAKTDRVIPFEQVYVTRPTDSAAQINAQLAAGLHVVVSPGIYQLDAPLRLSSPGQVLLGLGLATLVSAQQNPVVVVGDVDGVRVAGLLLQAGAASSGLASPTLLEWGSGANAGTASNPGVLSDVFARVGGPDGFAAQPVAVGNSMVIIRSGFVIIDNAWLWRADHTEGGTPTMQSNAVPHGLLVEGDDVTAYGLAVEHTVRDLVQWTGERGTTVFFQSELPYGTNQTAFGDPGYVGYRVGPHVKDHDAYGVGVYSFFRDHTVTVQSGIVAPTALQKRFRSPLSVFLSGHGGIQHVINTLGGASTRPGQVNYVC